MLADLGAGLVSGPRDIRFTSILVGVRGSGKTVVLSEIRSRAANDGWVVLSVDASTPGLAGRIRQEIERLPSRYEWLDLSGVGSSRSVTKSLSLKVGPYQGEKSTTEFHDAEMDLRHLLSLLADKAAENDSSVLLTVDEIHSIDKTEARRLLNDLQHVTIVDEHPLAFIGAGLPDMEYMLFEDRALTFFRRCHRYGMTPLEFIDAIRGLRSPIGEADGRIDDTALELMAGAVDGSPYKLQALGHAAWEIAGAPRRSISVEVARQAIMVAEQMVKNNISVPAFYNLSSSEQNYLIALAEFGDGATVASIAQRIGLAQSTVRALDRRLCLSGYTVKSKGGGRWLTNLVPGDVILQEADLGSESAASSDPRPETRPEIPLEPRPSKVDISSMVLCNDWMPRAKRRCVLPKGHQGRCRSKR